MTVLKRLGTAFGVAGAAMVTGHALVVDGGINIGIL